MRTGQPSPAVRVASAFAPGHVTGLFAPSLEPSDLRARGSVGAGIVLELGVSAEARFTPDVRPELRVQGDVRGRLPISEAAARIVVGGARGRLEVTLHHELPIGQGFGMSAAGATATALAVGAIFRTPVQQCREAAHRADLEGAGGLGGVSVLAGGGWELRTRAGLPPWGRVVHRPFRHRIFVAVVGRPIPSPRILSDAARVREITGAARKGLTALARTPDAGSLLDESERFTDRAGLAPASLRSALSALRRADAWAGQAMFGRSIWVVPRSPAARPRVIEALQKLRAPSVELRAADGGAYRAVRPLGASLLNRARLGRPP